MKIFFIFYFMTENKVQLVINRKKGGGFFLQLRGWILVVKVRGLWGWVMEVTSFWVTGQKSGLQLLAVPMLVVCV